MTRIRGVVLLALVVIVGVADLAGAGAPVTWREWAAPAHSWNGRSVVPGARGLRVHVAPGPVAQQTGNATPAAPQPEAAPPAPDQGATPPPAQGPVDSSTARGGRTYSGHPVTFNFEEADLKSVLRAFSDVTGLNVVIDPSIQGRVNVILVEVPWDQALDVILRQNKLGYVVEGTIVRIAPLSALADEEKQRSDLAKAQAEAGQLTTLTRQLSYANGVDLAALLKSARVLSERGDAFVDPRTNTLIITDLQSRLATASDLIATLDRPQPQVEIEARIVQTTKDYARQLGVQWGFAGRVDPALGNTTNLAFPNSGTLSGQAGAPGSGTAVNLGVAGAPSAVGLALGSVNGAFNLDLALSAAESAGQVRLLSTPRVSTQNNVEAEIAQGVQIPYQTVSNNTVTVQFKDAALTLKVTPQITTAGTVIMRISVDNGSRGQDVGNPPIPSINTQRANTTVMVRDGQTTVIGGIYSSAEIARNDRTPGLSRIPFLSWLFKRDRSSDESTELLIFITPRIIQGGVQG